MNRPRVLLADDHRMVTEGLKRLLADNFELVGTVEDGLALVAAAKKLRPDVIVADITMPHLNGIDALARLKKVDPDIKVVFLTMHKNATYARRALEAGATGFVLKHSVRSLSSPFRPHSRARRLSPPPSPVMCCRKYGTRERKRSRVNW